MPIGRTDIQIVMPGYDAQALVESLFVSPAGTSLARPFLSPLIQLANTISRDNALGPFSAGNFVNVPAPPLVPPVPAATILPNPALAPVQDFVSLLNPPELYAMLDMWWQIWTGLVDGNGTRIGHPSDIALLDFIRDYIATPAVNPANNLLVGPLSMWVPQVAYDGMLDGKLKLRLLGYQQVVLMNGGVWQQPAVELFLQYFAFGAHFVTIHSGINLPGTPALRPFCTAFGNTLGPPASRNPVGHSHYAKIIALKSGYAYPDAVDAQTAPPLCPYIVAFLVGRTAHGNMWNSFFQMEGWPTTGLAGGARHGADYDAHTTSLWNISTYGASLYSEKRGTTIFLAPVSWLGGNPQPQLPTVMAPYVGAGTPQSWLKKDLIRL